MKLTSSAQAGQDTFAYEVTGRKKDGTFLDVGAFNLCVCNNSYALERIGWRGLLVDIHKDEENIPQRTSPLVVGDATKLDWLPTMAIAGLSNHITYGSFDIDDATADLMDFFPLEEIRFEVLTVEHDFYRMGEPSRKRIRERIEKFGYHRVCSDVKICIPGYNIDGPFEDWWVAEALVPNAGRFISDNQYWQEILKDCL